MNQSEQPNTESSNQQFPLFPDTSPAGQSLEHNVAPITPDHLNTPVSDTIYPPRVYPLDPRALTEEQIAVAFAMTSRRPEPFDEIARQVSAETAADFHERWVLGYGHASVAEHAVIHLAAENISRLACDTLEDNRLASYTEKSSRYQIMPPGYYHTPAELAPHPALQQEYQTTCRRLFAIYRQLIDGCTQRLRRRHPQRPREPNDAYRLRLRRLAIDGCRAALPAATLTNVGVTANARTLEHAIAKLLSSPLDEERQLGHTIREQGRAVTPTLIKYAEKTEILEWIQQRQSNPQLPTPAPNPQPPIPVRLVHWDDQAEEKLTAALIYGNSETDYPAAWQRAQTMPPEQRLRTIQDALAHLGPHDTPPRELETVDYTFEFLLDYGAFREFRRHRMQTTLPQPLTPAHGFRIPPVIADAGLQELLAQAAETSERAFRRLHQISPPIAQYAVTHAHHRRLLAKLNLRQCYHLFKLRTAPAAHESIRQPLTQAMHLAQEKHPNLFRHLQLRR